MADPIYRNLVPGQLQIGPLVTGTGTNIQIEEFDVKPYDVNNQDFQVSRADEIRFGFDQIKPSTIELTFNVLRNFLLEDYIDDIPNFWAEMPTVSDLAREWRFDEGRYVHGAMKALYVCGDDGIGKVIYGRPGPFGAEKPKLGQIWTRCVGEFRRADTLYYSVDEFGAELEAGAAPQFIERENGDFDSWFRIIIEGPVVNPVITVGEQQVRLNYSIAADEIVEISSYPWQRRVVNNRRVNLISAMNGTTQYLDKLKLPANQIVPVRWTADNINTWVPALGNESWAEDIGSMLEWSLPSTFTTIAGRAAVRLDLFNLRGPRKFLGCAELGNSAHIIYNAKKFNSKDQYVEARIIEPFAGKSALTIMSKEDGTDFIAVEVESGFNNNWVRIKKSTGTTTLGSALGTSWQNPAAFWGENAKLSFEYTESTKRYSAKINGIERAFWVDSGDTKATDSTCRSQGALFDIGGDLLTIGTGFSDIMAYDKAVVAAPVGRVAVLWRDTWVSL